jgi:hypothetical protein
MIIILILSSILALLCIAYLMLVFKLDKIKNIYKRTVYNTLYIYSFKIYPFIINLIKFGNKAYLGATALLSKLNK